MKTGRGEHGREQPTSHDLAAFITPELSVRSVLETECRARAALVHLHRLPESLLREAEPNIDQLMELDPAYVAAYKDVIMDAAWWTSQVALDMATRASRLISSTSYLGALLDEAAGGGAKRSRGPTACPLHALVREMAAARRVELWLLFPRVEPPQVEDDEYRRPEPPRADFAAVFSRAVADAVDVVPCACPVCAGVASSTARWQAWAPTAESAHTQLERELYGEFVPWMEAHYQAVLLRVLVTQLVPASLWSKTEPGAVETASV